MVALANLGAWKSWTTALNQNCPVRSSSIHVDSGVVPKTLQCIRALHCLLPGSKSTNRRELARTTRWYAAIYGTTRLVIESYEEEIFNRKYLTKLFNDFLPSEDFKFEVLNRDLFDTKIKNEILTFRCDLVGSLMSLFANNRLNWSFVAPMLMTLSQKFKMFPETLY